MALFIVLRIASVTAGQPSIHVPRVSCDRSTHPFMRTPSRFNASAEARNNRSYLVYVRARHIRSPHLPFCQPNFILYHDILILVHHRLDVQCPPSG
jgi:hypothetical protein